MSLQWKRIKPALEALLELDPGAREAAVEEICEGDAALARRVRSLLAADADSGWMAPPAEPAASEARETIGPYRVLSEIGRGGQGVVYLAEDPRLGRRVAVKMLSAFLPGSGDALDRFRREAAVASRLDHPGICTVHEVGEEDGRPWIAMQFVEGESLASRFSRWRREEAAAGEPSVATAVSGPGGEAPSRPSTGTTAAAARARHREVIHLVEATARALHAAHEAGIVHRDVKPGNVVVRSDGAPVVLDFGLARDAQADTLTRTGDLFGTPAYMAPEQLDAARGPIDARTDVWALGVTLYEGLALARPFEAPTREALYRRILQEAPTPLPTGRGAIPRDLSVVVQCALEKEPDRRYASAADLAEDLRRVRDHEPIHARPAGPLLRSRRWARRNPALATALASVFLLLSGALALSLWWVDELAAKNREVRRQSELKDAALEGFRQMADIRRLEEATTSARALWPAYPQLADRLEEWLARYEGLAARLPLHEAALADLEALAMPWDEAQRRRDHGPALELRDRLLGRRDEIDGHLDEVQGRRAQTLERERERVVERLAELEREVATRKTWEFAGEDGGILAWKREALDDLVTRLRGFLAEHGTLASVRRRRAMAATIRQETVDGRREEWAAARARIAANPAYRGLAIAAQVGMIPLGPDPASGYEEFLHFGLHQGAPPERGADGRLRPTPETGLVFVLLPGGTFTMGAQPEDPRGLHYDPAAEPEEAPPHAVTLGPFLVSKYETTQAQWLRGAGRNPSYYAVGRRTAATTVTALHPVEQVDWIEASEFGRKQAMLLPTEAQWEYAARAGSATPWSFGDDVTRMPLYANIADEGSARFYPAAWIYERGIEDGFDVHAPVGSKRPNAFGLHDVHGNVYEWCRDLWSGYDVPVLTEDGRRERGDSRARVHRGGSFNSRAFYVRSAARYRTVPGFEHRTNGVRYVVPLQP